MSYYVGLMIERSENGSLPYTNGSGSGRPKNIRIRFPNTGCNLRDLALAADLGSKLCEEKVNFHVCVLHFPLLEHRFHLFFSLQDDQDR